MVTNAISRLRTLGLYQDNENEGVPLTTEGNVKNIIEKVHSIDVVPKTPAYNIGKLKERTTVGPILQMQGQRNEGEARPQLPTGQYTAVPTIVVPRKLTSLIIVKFYNTKGHQGISHTINMMRCYFW